MIRENPLPPADVGLFCLLAGLVGTFVGGYVYGEVNQVEHLPMIQRIMDADYLREDFFVNATASLNPRFYYVWLLAKAGAWLPLPVLFLLLTVLFNSLLAVVTWLAARRLSGGSEVAAVLACAMVIGVDAFNVGGAAQLPRGFLGPALAARPLALLGLWLTLNGERLRPALLFVGALVLHPLVGAETCAIAVGAVGASALYGALRDRSSARAAIQDAARQLVPIAVAVGGGMAVLYRGELAASMSTERFIHMLAEVRAPEHYLPSQFGIGTHAAFAVFCVATALAWLRWRREPPASEYAAPILATAVIVLLACAGGYVFVEILPTRLWVAAQTFRMTYLIKWLGFLLFAATASDAIRSSAPLGERISGSLQVLGVGRFQPAIALLGNLGVDVSRRLGGRHEAWATACAGGAALASVGLVAAAGSTAHGEPLALALVLGTGGCLLAVRSPIWRRAAPVLVVVGGAALLIGFRGSPEAMAVVRAIGVPPPRIELAETPKTWTAAAEFARGNTPVDAVFVVPPRVGGFRLVAHRAVVVDNKLFPFADADMEEWYERMLFANTGSTEGELLPFVEIERQFSIIDDARLRAISERYGATHALLWPPATTAMPLLYEDERFRIVRITRAAER